MNMMIGVYADQQTLRAIGLAVVWPKTGINNRTLVIKFVPQWAMALYPYLFITIFSFFPSMIIKYFSYR